MNVHISFATDDNYIPYLSVAIQSIFENCDKNNHYYCYIFHGNVSTFNQELLKKNVAKNFEIQFINVAKNFEGKKLYFGKASIEAYYRLYIPYFLTNVDKVLYLDCDLICQFDITEIYNINLNNFPIGAVKGVSEIGAYLYLKNHYWNKILRLDNPLNYFNSGVMLIDNKLFREKISFEDLCNFSETQNWPCYDQDVLNQIFQNDVQFLPNEWNFIKHHYSIYAPSSLLNEYLSAEKKPKIIHYASGYKPWSNKSYMPFSYEFWKYATRSSFSKIIIDHMNMKYTSFTNENYDVNTLPIFSILKVICSRILNKIKRLINEK